MNRKQIIADIQASAPPHRRISRVLAKEIAIANGLIPTKSVQTKSMYSRVVSTDGLVSVNDVFYQVPADLAGQVIVICPERLEYYFPPKPGNQPSETYSPTLQTLQLNTLERT